MPLLLLTENLISVVFQRVGYLAPFLLLVGAGAGLPLPEEITMLGSGFLLYQGEVTFAMIVGTCYVATLIGDSIPFWLGRHFGMSAMRVPLLARIVHPERMALLEKRFETHGNWAVFTCRFLPGVRMPGFFTAGTLGMSYPRFVIIDGAGALIMTPAWVLLGNVFGGKISLLERRVQGLNQILGFAILALLLVWAVRALVHRRERQVATLSEALHGQSAAAAGAAGPPQPTIPTPAGPMPSAAAGSGSVAPEPDPTDARRGG